MKMQKVKIWSKPL